jgi:HD-GYP domain-containing protein (c-di-GMP phosphodiesterase class II)
VVSLFTSAPTDLLAIALLTCLAATVELLQIDAYGDNTVSVTVALVFAAILVTGVPGLAAVSAAIALVHYAQKRPALYKTAFNWSNHLLAGLAPVIIIDLFDVTRKAGRVELADLPMLAAPVAAAALAYFVIETGLISVAIGLARRSSPVEIWRSQFQWLAGHYLVLAVLGVFLALAYSALGTMGMLVFVLPVLMMRFSQKQYVEKTEGSMKELRRMNEQLRLANEEVLHAHRAMRQFNEELFLTLSKIIDARDPFVGNHAAKVADYATAIAIDMGMPSERIEPLRQAGYLHDIGKLAISEQILHKPGKLTAEEYEIVKTHAALGGEFLEMCQGLRHLSEFVRHHHERWDGKGYPDRLKGTNISLEARILAVCDAAEAMASDRPYRQGMSLVEVIAEVRRCAGTQFDPTVAEAFCRIAERERERFVVNSAVTVLQRQALDRQVQPTGPLPKRDTGVPLPVSSS